MVTARDDVYAGPKQFVGDGRSYAASGRCVLAVCDDKVDLELTSQAGEERGYSLASGAPNGIADEKDSQTSPQGHWYWEALRPEKSGTV